MTKARTVLCKYNSNAHYTKSSEKSEYYSIFVFCNCRDKFEISPVSEIVNHLLKQKPSDKTAKSKNLYRLLADIVNAIPGVAYKLLVVLGQKHLETDSEDEEKMRHFPLLYKVLCTTHRNLKLEQALKQDLKTCWEAEPISLAYLCQFVYLWFEDEMQGQGQMELLRIFISALDPSQLQEIIWDVASGKYVMLESGQLNSVLGMWNFLINV